jgi:O-antigen/teichoic acid export membrane protein
MSSVPTSTVETPSTLLVATPDLAEAPVVNITSANMLVWGKRSALAIIDQALTSGSNFAVNLLLARWLTGEVYGAFAVVFTGYLFAAGFHTVLLLEPLSVMGPSRHSDRLPSYFRSQIMLHGLLTGLLSLAALFAGLILRMFVPGSHLIPAILGVAIALPFLLLLWLTRRMCYVMQRPSVAVIGSSSYIAFVLVGMLVLAHFSKIGPFSAFAVMGLGSILGSCLLFRGLGLLQPDLLAHSGISWRLALNENWNYGRWLVGSTILYYILTQTQMLLVAAWVGLAAAGTLRAMQLPAFLMLQVDMATGLLFLPAFSRDFGRGHILRMRHKAKLVSLGLTVTSVCFAIFLELFAKSVEHTLFGGKYSDYAWLMPVIALIPAANAVSTGYSMALRASQKPHFDLISNAVVAPIALLSACLFIYWWGIVGAVASMLLSFVLLSSMSYLCFYVLSVRNERSAYSSPVFENIVPRRKHSPATCEGNINGN